jgi:hypothetical protein
VPVIEIIVGVAAAVSALGTIYRKGVRPVIRAAKAIDEIVPTLTEIAYEFRPNSGKSLRDTIDRIEEASTTAATRLDEHLEDAQADRLALARLAGSVAVVQAKVERNTVALDDLRREQG